jgi:spore germination protein KC
MKKAWLLIILLISGSLAGCSYDMNRREIDEIDMALVLGIDYEDGQYKLCALYSPGSGSGAEGSEKEGSSDGGQELAIGTGSSAFLALEDLKEKNKKAVTLAQTGTFLIGEAAAKAGLWPCIDFLQRDETIKMEALIFITKGMSAEDFIKLGQENNKTVHEDLEAIKQKRKEQLTRNNNTMVNILNDCMQELSCVMIPYMTADEAGYKIEGYAVFSNYILRDYLDSETSDGVNFFRNMVRTYTIPLENQAGLLITHTKTRIIADAEESLIKIKVKLVFESMIREILSDKDIFTTEGLNKLTQEQNNYLKEILDKPVRYSVENGLDILNLARVVENQNVAAWKDIERDWSTLISEISYEYEIKSKVSKAFMLGVR